MNEIIVLDIDGNEVQGAERQDALATMGTNRMNLFGDQNASVVIKAHGEAAKQLSKVMVAREVPRDMEKIALALLGKNGLGDKEGLCADRFFAEQAIYEKPIDRNGTVVEGLSHYFAKYLSSIYGNLEVETIEHSKSTSTHQSQVQVVAWDQEHNTTRSETIVILHSRKAGDSIKTITDPDQIRLAVSREKSFLERNVLLDIFNPALTQKCKEACLKTLDRSSTEAMKNPAETLKKFAEKFGVNIGQLMKFLSISDPKALKPWQIRRLTGLYKSIEAGQTTPDKVFAGLAKGSVDLDAMAEPEPETQEPAEQAPAPAAVSNPEPPAEQEPEPEQEKIVLKTPPAPTPAPEPEPVAASKPAAPRAQKKVNPDNF